MDLLLWLVHYDTRVVLLTRRCIELERNAAVLVSRSLVEAAGHGRLLIKGETEFFGALPRYDKIGSLLRWSPEVLLVWC